MPTHHLDDFDNAAKGYGQGCQYEEQGDEGDEVGTQAGAFLAAC